MAKKSSSPARYVSWLLQQYNEIKKQASPPTLYRLVEIKKKDENQYELSFQVIGKAAIFKTSPQDLLSNERFIEYFSSKDISIVTQLACKELNKPKNKIVGKSFSEKLCMLLFKVKDLKKNVVGEYSASELSTNKELIQSLSPEDAHAIGYAAAQEIQQIENKNLRNKKERSKTTIASF